MANVPGPYKTLSICSLLEDKQYNPAIPSSYLARIAYTQLYRNAHWPSPSSLDTRTKCDSYYGSIFNIEFSPVNDVAMAVCSNRSIVCYESRINTSSPLFVVKNAHDDCVNCLTFLDAFSFATCSDDKTIRIWDLRNCKHCVAMLKGHKNWVKNIEYDRQSGRLFSIAFHDGVREWDTNRLCEYSKDDCSNLIFQMADPMRMKLSPAGDKMFISERDNVCWVIDRFDGQTVGDVGPLISNLRQDPTSKELHPHLSELKTNRPSLYVMCGLKTDKSYRTVYSAAFFPCGEFIGLRHMDIRNLRFLVENLTLFDLRETEYKPVHTACDSQVKYLMYADENSTEDSRDFIKEISVSRDGRVLASPFDTGVRLLAVDSQATPPDVYFDERYHSPSKQLCTQDLEILQTITGHQRAVLACKFANNDMTLATGGQDGLVLFHTPCL